MSALARLTPRPAVIAFDAYGTALDVHSAVARLADRIGPDAAALSALWRVKQLEYSWVRALAGRYVDFWRLTEEALDFALQRFPGVDPALRGDLLDAYRHLSAYPDVAPALARLRGEGYALCVFSNGAPAMLETALQAAGLTDAVDAVVSVDPLQTFKTAPATYQAVADRFAVPLARTLLVSSNRWDIAGAAAAGMPGVWINRLAAPEEYADLAPLAVVMSLADL